MYKIMATANGGEDSEETNVYYDDSQVEEFYAAIRKMIGEGSFIAAGYVTKRRD